MVARVLVTLVPALAGIYAFWDDAVGGGHFLNPFGIMLLLLAGLFWFGWGPIREGLRLSKDQTGGVPGLQVDSAMLRGLKSLGRGGRPQWRSPPS